MTNIIRFDDADAACHALVGGKGANLGRMTRAGFKVPPGFTVTTGAYSGFIQAARLDQKIAEILGRLRCEDKVNLDACTAQIRAIVMGAQMPPALATEIRKAYEVLGKSSQVAVRSSGTAEDLAGASFAGLHDTYLDVQGADDVVDAVRRCWASLWSSPAVAYRHGKKFGHTMVGMAVVVQTMVRSEVSGVMFTGNPLTAATDEIVINASWGLGEAVVQGIVSPDQYILRTGDLRVMERTAGNKTREIVRDPRGGRGTIEREVESQKQKELTLSEAMLTTLGELGRRVMAHYDGLPQDIEWAVSGSEVYLLQSRPITGVNFSWNDPLHQGATERTTWTTANLTEAFPGVPTPLTWSFIGHAFEMSVRRLFHALGVLPGRELRAPEDPDRRFYGIFYGRPAISLDLMRAMADSIPGTSGDEFEKQVFGSVRPGVQSRRSMRRYPIVALRLPFALLTCPARLRRLEKVTRAWWTRRLLPNPPLPESGPAVFAEARQRFEELLTVHGIGSMLIQAIFAQVQKAGAELDEEERMRLCGSYGAMEESLLVADLWEVACGRKQLDELIPRHGHHGPAEGELSSRSWREDSGPLEAMIATYQRMNQAESPLVGERERQAQRRAIEARLIGQASPLGSLRLRMVFGAARRFVPLRELGKSAFLMCIDVARAAARATGKMLVDQGRIGAVDDVFLLTADELAGRFPSDIGQQIAWRKRRRDEYQQLEMPAAWSGAPQVRPAGSAVAEAASCLDGSGASPGVAQGRVRIVRDPAEVGPFDPGDILVCETTDPSWAPLLHAAGAVVIDIGSLLSHGAIVARELGVPCVIGTRNGTRTLHDGDIVRVDGSHGTIKVIEPAACAVE